MTSRKERIAQMRARLNADQRAFVDNVLQGARPMLKGDPSPTPSIQPDLACRYEPFPLTELQQAYWIGRSSGMTLGNVSCFIYFETEQEELDLPRLTAAMHRLIDRHDMLRVIILRDGTQQILRDVPKYEIPVRDLRGAPDRDAQLARLREEFSHAILPTDQWPLFRLNVTRVEDRLTRLHFGIDTLIGDAWGLRIFFAELDTLYQDPHAELPPLTLSFRDYVVAEVADRQGAAYTKALSYWQERLPTLASAPALPLAQSIEEVTHPRFVRRRFHLPSTAWTRLRQHASRYGLTPTQAILAVYAEVLGRFSASQRFTLNMPLFNRLPLHPEVNHIVGEFASFTLIEIDRTERVPFCKRAVELQSQLIQALDHSRVHGVRILRELSRVRGQRVLMPVVFTSTVGFEGLAAPTALELSFGKTIYEITQTPQVWLDLQLFDDEGVLRLQLDAVDELFPSGMLDALQDAITRLLSLLAHDELAWKRESFDLFPLPPMTAPLPHFAHLHLAHQGVVQQVESQANAPVILTRHGRISYRELHTAARCIATKLCHQGVVAGTPVAIVMDKGWEQVVAVLGILLAGGAYVPIDAQSPADRRDRILHQTRAKYVLTQPHVNTRITWPTELEPIVVTEDILHSIVDVELADKLNGNDLAYVLFTSGSTGTPKGVMIEHRGIAQAIAATNAHFQVGPDDRVLGLTALHHDMSVYDMLGVPAAGGAVVFPSPDELRDPARWVDLIHQHNITIWNSVPAFMEMLLEYLTSRPGVTLQSLRLVFLGGDFIAIDLPERLRRVAPHARIVSVGGPTETTLWNIWYEVERVESHWKSIPYGRPIPGVRYMVLDDKLETCPVGVPGELCCAGVGLARGYWGDPALTAERFVTRPEAAERIYRTGDLGRLLPDGNLEILGRKDFQVKILGHRVETGEVEAALLRHASIRAAVVVGHGQIGRQHLAAYVIPNSGANCSTTELQRHLQGLLPAYMVPSSFTVLERFPLSANGKVDRRALLETQPQQHDATSSEPSAAKNSDAIVAEVASIMATLLGIPSLDPDADLMHIGADSIILVRFGNQIETRFGVRPPAAELFRAPSIRAIAQLLQSPAQTAPLGPSSGLGTNKSLDYQIITEPAERKAFRQKQLGIRSTPKEIGLPLSSPPIDEALLARYAARRSHRRFSLRLVPGETLGALLGHLRQLTIHNGPKYLYPSGGGLYGIQVYMHVKHGRVEDIPGGTYYYHPIQHQLIPLNRGAVLDRDIHVPFINQPIYDEAALSLFFVAQLDAIGPMYGDFSVHHATLEVGIISQLLDSAALHLGLGLCHIGHLEFDKIRPLFQLDPSHVFIHSMLAGMPEDTEYVPIDAKLPVTTAERVDRLRDMVKRLNPEEVKRLLAAKRAGLGTEDPNPNTTTTKRTDRNEDP